jgi:hypothetical protein
MMSRLALKGNRLLAFQVNGNGAEDTYGTVHFDVTLFALDATIRKTVGIL